MSILEVGATPEPNKPPKENTNFEEKSEDNNSIWAKFNDNDNIVDLSDVSYVAHNNKLKSSSSIKAFLERHQGEAWTEILRNEIKQLIACFNLECEKTESKDENNPLYVFTTKTETRKTGEVVGIMNDDGTSYGINIKDGVITKYSESGTILEQRKISAEESSLSTQELINKLRSESNKTQVPDQKVATENRKITGQGISGSYQLSDDGKGGYKLTMNLNIVGYKNQAVKAFKNGLIDDIGMLKIKPDENDQYNFRGVKSRNPNVLRIAVNNKAQQIACQTAIYKDLQERKTNGETLNTGELKFMQDYNTLLKQSNLKLNEQGDLEDL